MAQGSNELGVRSSRLSSILKKNSQMASIDSCVISNRFNTSTNRLPSDDSSLMNNQLVDINSSLFADRWQESCVKHNQLPSSDSGVSCKCNHYSCSSTEGTGNSSDDKQKTNSRKDFATPGKSVSFSLGSSTNHCVTDVESESDLEPDSDLTFVNTESTSTDQRNEDYRSHENSYTSRLSKGSKLENSMRNNDTDLKRIRFAYSEPDENRTMSSRCDSFVSQVNSSSTFPILGMSYNTDLTPDQIFVSQHQHQHGPPTANQGLHNLLQCRPCACHDNSHSNVEAIRFRSHSSIHQEVGRNFDPQSSAPFLDDRRYIESRGLCSTSHESCVLLQETQTSTKTARSAVYNNTNNNTVAEESAVSVPGSYPTKKSIKTYLIILAMFNIILFAAMGFLTSMLFSHQIYQECPLCKDVMDEVNRLEGGTINYNAIQEYMKENVDDGRCCLDHAFIFELMAHTNSSRPEPSQDKIKGGETAITEINNGTVKAAIHLQSMPFSSVHSACIPGPTEDSIKWNFKDKVNNGNFWDKTDSDTEILIPLTGIYYIYAMVQYQYINPNSTRGLDSMPTFEEFPLSVSLYKISHPVPIRSRIGTVILHCRFASQSIEHNSIIQKIVQLTKGDSVSLVASNKQFLSNKQNIHQIGIFKVN